MNASRPLRSSPLAGPSISSEGAIQEGSERPRPLRISSTPNLRSSVSNSSDIPPLFANSKVQSQELAMKAKPKPKPPRKQSAPPAFIPVAMPSSVNPPTRPPRSKFRDSTRTIVIPSPAADPPQFSRPRHRPSKSVPSVNWLTSNTFDEVPRFTRLGLSAPHVVLPMSAKKAHKRGNSLQCSQTESRSQSSALHVLFPVNRKRVSDATISTIRPATREGSSDGSEEYPEKAVLEQVPKPEALTFPDVRQSGYFDEEGAQYVMSHGRITSLLSPGSMELEFGIITEEGEDKGIILVSPLPVDVDLDTPLVESRHSRSLSESSVRSVSAVRARKNSAASRHKKVIRPSKSTTSVKAHERMVSNADSVLFASIPITRGKHTKGLSFLSLSSDGSEHDILEDDIPPVPAIPEYIHAHKRSIDTFSVCSDELRDAEELLMDVLAPTNPVRKPRPTFIPLPGNGYNLPAQSELITTPKPTRSRSEKARSFWPPSVIAPPPSSTLPSPPSSPSASSPVSPTSPASPVTPNVQLPALPTPTRPRSRSKVDDAMVLLGLNGALYTPTPVAPTAQDFPSPPLGKSQSKRFRNTMEFDRPFYWILLEGS
ncbi:hypothetical protein VNI00_000283 [Paramarasmius palmivorus]|uniref:Uncharacterized protein n=1 Tax=Paramarasmius palmivorus TaxID=297713 RepID=A0AAW0EDW0_9AGAR